VLLLVGGIYVVCCCDGFMHHGILKSHEDWYMCSVSINSFCLTDLKNYNVGNIARRDL
jgi:hypothetical protein